jgi:DNA-binding XRE family transcriptional regulator
MWNTESTVLRSGRSRGFSTLGSNNVSATNDKLAYIAISLRTWRKESYLNQRGASRILGVARETVCRWEKGNIGAVGKWILAKHNIIDAKLFL